MALSSPSLIPSAGGTDTFTGDHLLRVGVRGVNYQLLVLLEKVTKLTAKNKAFEAVCEIKDRGNLDDIAIIQDKKGKVQTYQVKYYQKPIKAKHFAEPATRPLRLIKRKKCTLENF